MRARLLLAVALLGGWGGTACTPTPLRGRSISDRLDSPDAIESLGRAGDVVYALTRSPD